MADSATPDAGSSAADASDQTVTAHGRSLAEYAAVIQVAFPALFEVAPVSLLGEGWDSVAVETVGGVVFRFPKREPVAASLSMEARLLPFLRGHLTPDIPVPTYEAAPATGFEWGFMGYAKLPGLALAAEAIDEDNIERLAAAIGHFLAELHRFPAERARALGAPGPRQWKPPYVALSEAVLPALRRQLRLNEFNRVRRWWREYLADERAWDFPATLVHGDLAAEHLLVDDEHRDLLAVIDWGDAAVGDPAIDFVGLMRAYGSEFTWRVVEAYGTSGARVDGDLLRRVRQLAAVVPFYAVRHALGAEDEAGPTLEEAISELRAGPVLAESS
jgi:aminoglycoside 2''-phosphotransferase